jgi:hypothetical protein
MADDSATALVMEARLKDYISGSVDRIIGKVREFGGAAQSTNNGVALSNDRAAGSFDRLGSKVFNVDRTIGKLARNYLSLSLAVFGTIKVMEEATKSYEEWAKASGGEEAEKINEAARQHELALIRVGQRLEGWKQGMSEVSTAALNMFATITNASQKAGSWLFHVLHPDSKIAPQETSGGTATATETTEEILSRKKKEKDAQEYREKHISDLDQYGKILTEKERERVRAAEKVNDEWIKKNDEADTTIRNAEKKFAEERANLSKEEEDKEIAALNVMYQAREENEKKTTEMIKEEERIRSQIRQTTVQGIISVSNAMASGLEGELSMRAKSKSEQKKAAMESAIINYAMGLGGAGASIWTTAGGSWQEKLAESIAIDAELTAAFALQMSKISSAATGGRFQTHGPGLYMFGDNASGVEDVTVRPRGTPNVYGGTDDGGSGGITIHVHDATTGDKVVQLFQRALRDGSAKNLVADFKGKLAVA